MIGQHKDVVIIGAGIYGLYSALYLANNNSDMKIFISECEKDAVTRATYANQARVHMGYHYPRSFSTAKKTADYFREFNEEFNFCINKKFEQIYAISSNFSWTDATQFERFCEAVRIPYEKINPNKYFQDSMIESAYRTEEYTYDANILRDYFLKQIQLHKNVEIVYECRPIEAKCVGKQYVITFSDDRVCQTEFVLNTTYSATNIINGMFHLDTFDIKYELCEIILCELMDQKDSNALLDLGVTVMDGPFFSIMPFGKSGVHSLTSVTFTPHKTSYSDLPKFECQKMEGGLCEMCFLGNCNYCRNHPHTAWKYMEGMAKKYLKDNFKIHYLKSLYSIKPILLRTEIDDARPTVIKVLNDDPLFISILSGKVSTIYDLKEELDDVLNKRA